jgi:molybdopterin-containing oxidoreductase family membrane subunit
MLVAGAFLATRYNVVIPGLILPELEGLPEAYADSRLNFSYAPSVGEWLVFLFIASLAVGIFYAGYRLLPLISEKEA